MTETKEERIDSSSVVIRDGLAEDIDEISVLFRSSYRHHLPFLPELHTPEEDRLHFSKVILPFNKVLVAENSTTHKLVGFIAFDDELVHHLWLAPGTTRCGIGTRLLSLAKVGKTKLRLWAFQKNEPANDFYKKQGFKIIEATDGRDNEEHEPDYLFEWNRTDY